MKYSPFLKSRKASKPASSCAASSILFAASVFRVVKFLFCKFCMTHLPYLFRLRDSTSATEISMSELMRRHLVKPRARHNNPRPCSIRRPWLAVEAVGGDHVFDDEGGLVHGALQAATPCASRSSA